MAESEPSTKITRRLIRRMIRAMARGLLPIAALWGKLIRKLRTSYRPERRYMRGPGPKWH